jgi:hypothetical protein
MAAAGAFGVADAATDGAATAATDGAGATAAGGMGAGAGSFLGSGVLLCDCPATIFVEDGIITAIFVGITRVGAGGGG